jgi:hypothetical protein
VCRARGICALQVRFSLNPKASHPVGSIYKEFNDPFRIASPTVIHFKAATMLPSDKVEVRCGTSMPAERHLHLQAPSVHFSEVLLQHPGHTVIFTEVSDEMLE